MADQREVITKLARRVHAESIERNIPTRTAATHALASVSDIALLRCMAAEFLVDLIARSANRNTIQPQPLRVVEDPPPARPARMPRKGSAARVKWETETPEGRNYAAAVEQADAEASRRLSDALNGAIQKYAETLRVQWVDEILDREFRDETGVSVAWGEATREQHEFRRDALLAKATSNIEDAALHEAAIRELKASKALTLRLMVSAA